MRFYREILLSVLCTGIALVGSPVARAQDAASATLSKYSPPVEATPTTSVKKQTSKPTLEISAKMPNQKRAPVAEQTPRAEELATPTATAEERSRVKKHATPAAQVKAPAPPVIGPMSLSAAKAVVVNAPLPGYPYQARRAHITGSGVCVMLVHTASGKVTAAMMAESTGNAILDKVTTDAFRQWRFKRGTVSRVRVPVTYE